MVDRNGFLSSVLVFGTTGSLNCYRTSSSELQQVIPCLTCWQSFLLVQHCDVIRKFAYHHSLFAKFCLAIPLLLMRINPAVWFVSIVLMLRHTAGLALHHHRHVSRALQTMKGFRLNSSAAGSIPRSTPDSYLAIHVRGKLTPGEESRQKFYAATLQNARNSILEPGVSRFDLLRGVEDPSDFLLVEVYKDENSAPAAHKETAHYQQWREAVEPLMAQPRAASKYHTLFPPLQPLSSSWDTLETSSDVDLLTHQQTKPWDAELYSVTRSDHIPQKQQQGGMLAVAVDVQVVPGQEEAFIAHTLDNCRCSIREPGVHRFDLLRSASNSSNFVLVEIYSSAEAPVRHKDTAHYKRWAAAVADMMARPRAASKYATLFPAPLFFHKVPHLVYPGEGQQFLDQLLADADAPGGGKGTPAVGGVARGGGESAWDGRRGLESAAPQLFGFVGPKILMGRGIATDAIQSACKSLQVRRPLLVTGSTGLRRHEALLASIAAVLPEEEDGGYDVQQHCVQIQGEPTVEDALRLVQVASEHGCDSVIALGGGSAVDAGKAAAALIPNLRLSGSDIFDYLEVIGKGLPLSETPLPFIAVPTTSGTGSEVTKNAVLKSDAHGLKVSIRHDKMLPDAAVIDPLLTLSCPPSVTAHVGMDALCQLIEPYICNVPNPFVDALCR